ncbi:hypothetical protein Clacol_005883 [Clathrus columnatus]|uniref:Uncharacterized protein n=1 Tax=Clathrus columnatus TaxID=1419009 RepID=A0AAV5AD75_9AGAM|nr:hypothetical protein Clacol_005883 [Clathrus columnatus]
MSLSEFQSRIVEECDSKVQVTIKACSGPRVIFLEDYVVKFNHNDILNEGDTQEFVYEKAVSSPVYDCFSWNEVEYLVMERIKLPTVKECIERATSECEEQYRYEKAFKDVAKALGWLFNLSAPDGAEIGLLEGKYALTMDPKRRAQCGLSPHSYFGRHTAPLRYTDASALERHINKARLTSLGFF